MTKSPEQDIEEEKASDKGKKKKGSKAPTHRFTLTAAGVAACLAAMPGVITALKGEPLAEETWRTLKKKVDEQSKFINLMKVKLVYFQAQHDMESSLSLKKKLNELQKKLDELRGDSKVETKKESSASKFTEKPKCNERQTLGVDGKCHWVRKAVAAKIKQEEKEKEGFRKQLEIERRKRIELEMKKLQLSQSIQNAQKFKKTTPMKLLPDKPTK